MTAHILIIDDEKNICTMLARALDLEGFAVSTAMSAAEGYKYLTEQNFSLVLLDLKLPDMSGLDLLNQLRQEKIDVPVIMMSGHGTLDSAIQATKLGALDFLEKPVEISRLLLTVQNALELSNLQKEVSSLQEAVPRLQGMVGSSKALINVIDDIKRAAPTKARVFIHGESGVGKELVAKAIHDLSKRHHHPFVKLNCAAIAENLVESELFGHEKGAFTGAEKLHLGRFERADGGTLFLDEIGEMSLSIQSRLLRVIQEGEFERVGGQKSITVDVRIIAATHRNLAEEVSKQNFREDLYYRLNVLPISVPPLRQRLEDIADLAHYFLDKSCRENDLDSKEWSEEALLTLKKHQWPGNVRELVHVVERLAILSANIIISKEDVRRFLPAAHSLKGENIPQEGALYPILESFERRIIEDRIERFNGNMSQAAEDLGLERSHLYKKVRKLGIVRYGT